MCHMKIRQQQDSNKILFKDVFDYGFPRSTHELHVWADS